MDVTTILNEVTHLGSPAWWQNNTVALLNIIMIDVVLAGDNAIIVGLAASRVRADLRSRVIFWGIAGAVVLRILFAAVTTQLLAIVGLTLAGGLLLLFVCWKMYRQITGSNGAHGDGLVAGGDHGGEVATLGMGAAVLNIILADVSMSLDNVLAVAGAAKGSPLVLVIGLAVAIVLMAIASRLIADLLVKYPWITWIGLLVILWVALDMIYAGSHEIACKAYDFACSEDLFSAIAGRLGWR